MTLSKAFSNILSNPFIMEHEQAYYDKIASIIQEFNPSLTFNVKGTSFNGVIEQILKSQTKSILTMPVKFWTNGRDFAMVYNFNDHFIGNAIIKNYNYILVHTSEDNKTILRHIKLDVCYHGDDVSEQKIEFESSHDGFASFDVVLKTFVRTVLTKIK